MRGKPKKGKRAKRRQRRIKRACFEEGPRFSGAKHTETGWADGVFLHHAGRKDFFDTLRQRETAAFSDILGGIVMKLTWLGHACFLLEEDGYRIVLDPYTGVAGYPPLHIQAHAVFCSHGHFEAITPPSFRVCTDLRRWVKGFLARRRRGGSRYFSSKLWQSVHLISVGLAS